MALKLYRRHRTECEGGHPKNTRTGRFEEGRRGWKKCDLTFKVDSLQAAEIIQLPSRELYLLWNPEARAYEGQVRHDANPVMPYPA